MKTAIRLCFIIIFTFFYVFLHTLIFPYKNSFLTKCFSLGRKWEKLPGMRNLIVICANQMDLIRICRYLSYFHGSSLVVFSSKFVRESIFTNVPPLETATTFHVVFQHQRLHFLSLWKTETKPNGVWPRIKFLQTPQNFHLLAPSS